jgi:type I site-specific restriction-modification system R (restriction) subunit
MSARLFTVFGESKEDRTEREIADRIADTKQISAASKLLREANLTEEQKQKRTTLQKLGEQQRKIKRQEAHDAWLATLSETDRLLARSTPVGPAELSRMTEAAGFSLVK